MSTFCVTATFRHKTASIAFKRTFFSDALKIKTSLNYFCI